MLDLDRLDDGSLDLRQRFFSGSFYSSRLEEAYKEYLQSIWVPRIRALSLAVIVWEMIAMIDSFACHCGVRVGTYEGWALVWSLSFPTAVSLLTLVVLSPFFSQFKRYMPLNVVVLVVILCVGYTPPLSVYLSTQASPANATISMSEATALVGSGAWFASTCTVVCLTCSTAFISTGLGAIPIIIFLPLPMVILGLFERSRLNHAYGVAPNMWGQAFVVYFVCSILAYFQTANSRRQYLVRIYVQFEQAMRVEQLEAEKDRLDYERRFALQKSRGPPESQLEAGANLREDGNQVCSGSIKETPGGMSRKANPPTDAVCSGIDPSNGSLPRGRALSLCSSSAGSFISEPELGVLPNGGTSDCPKDESRVLAGCTSRSKMALRSSLRNTSRPASSTHQEHLSLDDLELGVHSASDECGYSAVKAQSICSDASHDASNDASFTSSVGPRFSEERENALSHTLDSMGILDRPSGSSMRA